MNQNHVNDAIPEFWTKLHGLIFQVSDPELFVIAGDFDSLFGQSLNSITFSERVVHVFN